MWSYHLVYKIYEETHLVYYMGHNVWGPRYKKKPHLVYYMVIMFDVKDI